MTTTQWLLIGGPFDGRVVNVHSGMTAIDLDHCTPDRPEVFVRHRYHASNFWWRDLEYRLGAHNGAALTLAQQQSLGTLVRRLGLRPVDVRPVD